MVSSGVAVGFAHAAQVKVLEGAHVIVPVPVDNKFAEAPYSMEVSAEATTNGLGLTQINIESSSEQIPFVYETIYVVLPTGETVMLAVV